MIPGEFEEKEFEGPLNAELVNGTGIVWPPGQVLEGIVGFDAALFVSEVSHWIALGYPGPLPGGVMVSTWWSNSPAKTASQLPDFKLNLFLQYKRVDLLESLGGPEGKYWKRPYYRYFITDHQQLALEACSKNLGSNGLVAYSAPAFAARVELFRHILARTVMQSTNFAKVTALTGHSKYTFVNPGLAGRAFSEPEDIPYASIREALAAAPEISLEELLQRAASAAKAAVREQPTIVGSAEVFDDALRVIERLLRERIPTDAFDACWAYSIASVFCWMARVGWLVVGTPSVEKPAR